MDTIAHEIAHFILDHNRFKEHRRQKEIRESEANDLAKKWGFRRLIDTIDTSLDEEMWLE